ncbi:MAG: thiamine biosynthesis protein ThiC [Methanoregula sp. PtaU1.Bin051]|nr:MAG: thiamine biosynthesis protein ThiC [Methanoregula sp. PtaU1.Bin051]
MEFQAEQAQSGVITPQMKAVAAREGIDESALRDRIASGSVIIMHRGKRAVGIGRGLRTKINVNLGTSTGKISIDDELQKVRIAEEFGADTISDLSMGGDIPEIRKAIMAATTLPITTVPIYETAARVGLKDMTSEDILATMRAQAEHGVSSFVVHCVNDTMLSAFRRKRRILGIVSKGGSITSAFMLLNGCENPFTEHFDKVLAICRAHDIVLSLGNTARSGCIGDRRDRAQVEEARLNIALARRAHEAGVQVIIEGCGGHISIDRIPSSIRYYKKKADFPLFVAGPLPTDIAAGYDHIAGCTGASIASAAGADYLCYITPAEHLGLPTPEAVKEGLIAFRIAAHIGDTVKYRDRITLQDNRIAKLRADLDRDGQIRCALDPARARELSDGEKECTMCGEFCAIKIMRKF